MNILVVIPLFVLILRVVTRVHAKQDTLGMETRARTLMNAIVVNIHAMITQFVPTLLEVIPVHVKLDTLGFPTWEWNLGMESRVTNVFVG